MSNPSEKIFPEETNHSTNCENWQNIFSQNTFPRKRKQSPKKFQKSKKNGWKNFEREGESKYKQLGKVIYFYH